MRRGFRKRGGNSGVDPEYSLDDDLIRTDLSPFEFYSLKPGVKAKRTAALEAKNRAGSGRKVTLRDYVAALVPPWLIPFHANDVSLLRRFFTDLYALDPLLWAKYLGVYFGIALLPAVSLYYSGQLLSILQKAVDKREMDRNALIVALLGVVITKILSRFAGWVKYGDELSIKVEQYFGERIISAKAHLDVPTSQDPITIAKLARFQDGGRSPWHLVGALQLYATIILQVISQVFVLLHVLKDQQDSSWLVIGSFLQPAIRYIRDSRGSSWAAIRSDSAGLTRSTINNIVDPRISSKYRQEIVANSLGDYFTEKFQQTTATAADSDGAHMIWYKNQHQSFSALAIQLMQDGLGESPRVVFALKALRTPTHIPLSLATLTFVQSQAASFTSLIVTYLQNAEQIHDQITTIKDLYELDRLPNKVKDGYKPLERSAEGGVGVEFENVTFNYPGQAIPAIKNVSFKLEPGALCVIVGANGQGKSSILKLLTRLHDPTQGDIRIQGENIQSYELESLRRGTSVLFQDFAIFPMTFEDNIRLGDPRTASLPPSEAQHRRVELASSLGGADEFINKLSRGYGTVYGGESRAYQYTGPDGQHILAAYDRGGTSEGGGKGEKKEQKLSGGQTQRLALARTFMKPQEDVSLLIYDEPSASLDPQAEYDLFERLKALRGSKTMIFSTHRFGFLTKHADVILYLKDSTIVEIGTHAELMERGGEYAHLYTLQASAFT